MDDFFIGLEWEAMAFPSSCLAGGFCDFVLNVFLTPDSNADF